MIHKILFLDIETVPVKYHYAELDERGKKLWTNKWKNDVDMSPEEQYKKAGIYAEFAKVICIGLGYLDANHQAQMKVLCNDDEAKLLKEFNEMLNKFFQYVFKTFSAEYNLCAHNGREFDFPFLCRRMIVNSISIPDILRSGRRDLLLDTMEMWKFGDYKNYTSLDLLAYLFGIESPKDDMDGSMVAQLYYERKQIDKIKMYCERDVKTLIEVYKRLNGIV